MLDEEKKAYEELKKEINKPLEVPEDKCNTFILYNIDNAKIIVNLIEKQKKEIEFYKKEELGYIAGYEDGKRHKQTAVAIRNENAQYEIIRKKIEIKDEKIEQLRKETKELQNYIKEYLIPKSTINLLYVSKDKIREKIKEYKGLKEIDKMAYEEQIKPLQELLEEE